MAAPKKILVLGSYAQSLINFRGALMSSLIEKGVAVHAAAPGLKKGTKEFEALLEMGVTPHDVFLSRTGLNPFLDFISFLGFLKLMFQIKPTVFLGYTIKPVIYGGLAAALARIPMRCALITGLGYAFTGSRSGWITKIAKQLYRISLSRINIVFFQNPDDRDLFCALNLLPCNADLVVVNGSGVDINFFSVVDRPLPISFLLIARLLGDKGVREYISAAEIIKSKYPFVVFNLVGWIDSNPDAISEHELSDWVSKGIIKFWGRLEDVRPAIRESSVYVLPSYREGTPRTTLEAMSMGRPVITTDAPGCRETVVHGENGYLIPVGAVNELAEAMLCFIENPSLIDAMGVESRKIVEEKYDVKKVNDIIITNIFR